VHADAHFLISADRCPGLLCRFLGLFAQQDRMVRGVEVEDTGRTLRTVIQIGALEPARAEALAERMRSMVGVRRVTLRCGPRKEPPVSGRP
jgi:hypothetical protein